MNNYKNMIKKSIIKLPFGESLLLPTIQYTYSLVNVNFWIDRARKDFKEKKEAKRILNCLEQNNFDTVLIVYDMKVSAPTFGDFMYLVMVARFFITIGKKVKFIIIDSDFREDTLKAYPDHDERKKLVTKFKELPEVLLDSKNCDIQILHWNDFYEFIKEQESEILCLFKDKIKIREPIYIHSFNLCNLLASYLKNGQINNFLLNKEEIASKVRVKFPQSPYITWACRYSIKWSFERNINEIEFINIYNLLQNKFPNKQIMVVSDEIGCSYFKKISQKNNLSCLFSKDFSDTFMGDCALVIGSDYFFQLRGGGIATAAIYSTVPYYIIVGTVHEKVWKKKGIALWSHENQIFKTSTNGMLDDL